MKGRNRMTSKSSIGQNIRQHRKLHGMTQKDLAEKVGVKPLHIMNIENGKKGVSHKRLLQICDCFHITLAELLPAEEHDDFELRQRWRDEIVSAIDELDTARLGIVKTMVCSLQSG
jgi:transcriptional regulator with XRE-family HTH domain